MADIILLVGPPGSGKSTWASLYIKDHKAKILSRDALRLCMQNGKYNSSDERVIKRIRDYAVENWLRKNYSVIIDDLNLTPDVFPRMVSIANRVGHDVKVKEHIMQIEQSVCWHNNINREHGVVEQGDWNAWWLKYSHHKKHDPYIAISKMLPLEIHYDNLKTTELTKAIILDIDGTIAMHPDDRSPYDHTQAPYDLPNAALIEMLQNIHIGNPDMKFIFVTGRSEKYKLGTFAWLESNFPIPHILHMRPIDDDSTPDFIIKKNIYETKIKDKYFITAVFDDREQAVTQWRELGIPTYQNEFGRF